jgi:putative membrane protein
MKKILYIFLTSLGALTLASCGGHLSYEKALTKNRQSIESMEKLADAQFLVEAKSFHLLETRLNEAALEKGYSSDLVKFASKNVEDDKDLSKQLSKLSRKEKIKLPSEMKEEHRQLLDRLTSTARSDFDEEFVDILTRVNEDNTRLYEEHSSAAQDADIRSFAARQLGLLRAHAEELEKVDEQLMSKNR